MLGPSDCLVWWNDCPCRWMERSGCNIIHHNTFPKAPKRGEEVWVEPKDYTWAENWSDPSSSNSWVNGMTSIWRLEMSTVTQGLLWRYWLISALAARVRKQNVNSVGFQMMRGGFRLGGVVATQSQLQFRKTMRHWRPKQNTCFWGFYSRNRCKILHLGKKQANKQYTYKDRKGTSYTSGLLKRIRRLQYLLGSMRSNKVLTSQLVQTVLWATLGGMWAADPEKTILFFIQCSPGLTESISSRRMLRNWNRSNMGYCDCYGSRG